MIGPLAIPQLPFYFACLLPFCCLNQKPLNIYLLVFASFPYPKSLVNTFCSSLGSTLLLIKNTTIDPLHLWVIKKRFLAPLPGIVALLVSEVGKETFTLCCCFYFAVATFSPYGPLYCWFVAGKEPPHNCGGHSYPY